MKVWLRQDVVDKLFQLTAWVPRKWESKLKNVQHDRPPEWYWTTHRIHPMSFYKLGNTMEKLLLTDSARIDIWHVSARLRGLRVAVVPDFSACRHFSRGVIFTRARVSLALYYPWGKMGATRSHWYLPVNELSQYVTIRSTGSRNEVRQEPIAWVRLEIDWTADPKRCKALLSAGYWQTLIPWIVIYLWWIALSIKRLNNRDTDSEARMPFTGIYHLVVLVTTLLCGSQCFTVATINKFTVISLFFQTLK